ncbi:AAA family ATPase [Nonomuraea sp. NPDC049480]|uniref:helix-turn-helix transcriptional regulator n=1 Tax=Nonomuraea sp. NPDC049480 TaxID=3364353 RepID=UPI00378CEC4B
MFVGRTAELALLRAELRAAGGGRARRVVIEGPEGIGKTALVHHTLGGEAGVRLLAASGEEGERELALGVMRQLADEVVRAAGDTTRRLADEVVRAAGGDATRRLAADGAGRDPRGAGLDGGVAGLDGVAAAGLTAMGRDPCAAGQVICDVIGALQAHGPVAVLIDDAQWADGPSLHALGYVLRRLRAGRVIVLVACRDVTDPWLPDGLRRLLTGDDTLRITLGGLSATDLAELATALAPAHAGAPAPGLGAEAAERLREHTLGNPMHARALLATVSLPALADAAVRLPAPRTYLRSFAVRLDGRTPAARRLVGACAVLGQACPLHVAAAVAGGVDEPLNALEEAVAAGLLRELPGRMIGFAEPLARAAAYDGLGAGTRARLHLAAAALADDTGTALRHRAAAAGGPDDALVEELTGYAAKAAQHGRWRESAAHLELAAGLTEPARAPARRDELRTAVLEHVLIGGDVLHAERLAGTLGGCGAHGAADPRPARQYALGRLALVSGRFDEASELLAEAWRHREPAFAADVAEQLAWLYLVTGGRAAAVRWARLAIEQAIQGTVARPYDVLALGGAPGAGAPPGSLAAAVVHLGRDSPERACIALRQAVAGTERAGLTHHRLLATALLAAAEHAYARWDDAAARAERALAEATALGQRWLLPCLEAVCVAPLAACGQHDRALAHATAAMAAARRMRHAMGEAQAGLALALLGVEDAAPRTGPWDVSPCAGDPFVPDPRPRRIETMVAGGRLEEAERALAAFDGLDSDGGETGGASLDHAESDHVGIEAAGFERPGRDRPKPSRLEPSRPGPGRREPTGRGRQERERAVRRLAPRREAERIRLGALVLAARNVPAQAEESFGRALALVEGGVCPLEEAKVLLDLGRLLRRTGRRKAAAERLGAARAIFERLGARPLVDRCAHELEACGLEPQATVRLGLTPQELSTATLVAHGLTNRQIATELLLSVKTVEYHIGKIYTKLGISSRVALAAKVATDGGPA